MDQGNLVISQARAPSLPIATGAAVRWADAPGLAEVLSPLQPAVIVAAALGLACAALSFVSREAPPAPVAIAAPVKMAEAAPVVEPVQTVRPSAPSAPVLEPGARAPTPLLPSPPTVDERQVWTTPAPSPELAPPPPPPPPQALLAPRPDNSFAGAVRNFERDLARLFGQDDPRSAGRGKKKGHKDRWR